MPLFNLGSVLKEKVYDHIDRNIDAHVTRMQRLLRQPSVSQTGEGMEEIVVLLKDWLKELGCGHVEAVKPDFYWPIVFGEYDTGAERTLILYGMYDVQPVDEHLWKVPPFEAKLVELPPFKRVVMCRGSTNTKGPMSASLNALESIQQAAGELPVNILFVFEGEEEMGSRSMPGFVKKYAEKLSKADGVYFPIGSQDQNGLARPLLGSEGLLYIELETSGKRWGRGPTEFGVHGGYKRILDSPAWRHIDMLGTLTSENGNDIHVEGWYDDIAVPTEEDKELLEKGYRKSIPAVEVFDPELIKASMRVNHFKRDMEDPGEILSEMIFSTSFNLDGIWGGWTGPGTKTFLPDKVTSKHNIRFVPRQTLNGLQKKIRDHLDSHDYGDVELRKLGGYSWGLGRYKDPVAEAMYDALEEFGCSYSLNPPVGAFQFTSPAWPAYVFLDPPLEVPIIGGSLGHGALAHSPNEYYVVEGCDAKHGRVHGLAGAEKSMVSFIYHFANR
jgi:acetylornithine deacetylase/succinyl-diaminopimelate desuccinylase-like protein